MLLLMAVHTLRKPVPSEHVIANGIPKLAGIRLVIHFLFRIGIENKVLNELNSKYVTILLSNSWFSEPETK